MARTTHASELWKLEVDRGLDLEKIESALMEACRAVMEGGDPLGPDGVLERVDRRGKETAVFVRGNQPTAEAFSRSLNRRAPRAKVAVSRISQAELGKFR